MATSKFVVASDAVDFDPKVWDSFRTFVSDCSKIPYVSPDVTKATGLTQFEGSIVRAVQSLDRLRS